MAWLPHSSSLCPPIIRVASWWCGTTAWRKPLAEVGPLQPPTAAAHCSHAAFYADCEHEVKPVSSGCRLALVYNLLHVGSGPAPAVPDSSRTLGALRNAVQHWRADDRGPRKLCIMLDHQYTQAGITAGLRALKGKDRAAGLALHQLAEEGALEVHLAIVSKHEQGAAEEEDRYDRYGWGCKRRCAYYDEDSDVFGDEDDDGYGYGCGGGGGRAHVMDEVFDVSRTVMDWVMLDGHKRDLGEMQVDEEREVLPCDYFETTDPDDEHYEGYTGNAGATLERWYHRAALVVWPPNGLFAIKCDENITGAVRQLAADVAGGAPPQQCAAFANAAISEMKRLGRGKHPETVVQLMDSILGMARAQHATGTGAYANPSASDLAARCLFEALPGALKAASHAAAISRLCGTLGWAAMQPALLKLVRASLALGHHSEVAALLHEPVTAAQRSAGLPAPAGRRGGSSSSSGRQQTVAVTCAAAMCREAVQAVFEEGPASARLSSDFVSRLLITLAQLGGKEQEPLVRQMLRNTARSFNTTFIPALLLVLRQFGWALVQPVAQKVVSSCEADSNKLPAALELFSKLAEAAVGAPAPGAVAAGAGAQPVAAQLLQPEGQHEEGVAGVSGAGQTGTGGTGAQQQQQSHLAAVAQQQVQMQEQVAAMLARLMDVTAQQADLPQQVPAPPHVLVWVYPEAHMHHGAVVGWRQQRQQQQRQQQEASLRQQRHQAELQKYASSAAAVVNTFTAVHALLPTVGLMPCHTATVAGLPVTGLADRLALLVTCITAKEGRYPPAACLTSACKQLHQALGGGEAAAGCPALLALTQHTVSRLRALAAPFCSNGVPRDWRRECQLRCSCQDCAAMQAFLLSTEKQAQAFVLVQQKRNHLQHTLRQSGAGSLVSQETVRTGSPHSLVLTKTAVFWGRQQGKAEGLLRQAAELQALLTTVNPWEGAAAAAAALVGAPMVGA